MKSLKVQMKKLNDKIDRMTNNTLNNREFIRLSNKYHAKKEELIVNMQKKREPYCLKLLELQRRFAEGEK